MKNVKEFKIKIEGQEWTDTLDKAFNNKKKDLKVDGFRKGACPKDVYIKKFGIETLFMDAVDLAINDAYHKVLDNNDVKPVCEPKVDIVGIDKEHVEFVFNVVERPEIKLGDYKKLGVKHEKVEVTAEEVEHELGHLKEKFADVVEVSEGKAELKDTAVIDFKGVVDGKELEGGSGANYPLELGSNTFIPGFEDGVVGMTIGEEKVLKLKFPENYVDNLKNKDVEFTVKLVGIKKRILPEVNEDFYKDLGYDDVKTPEELNEKIKEHLMEHKNADEENRYVDAVIKKAMENLNVEINTEIIEAEINHMLEDYRRELQMQGISLEQYLTFTKSNIDDFKKMLEPEASNRIKTRYLLEEIVKKEKITVSEEDINNEIKHISEQYNVKEDEVLSMIGGEEVLKYDLEMRKAIDVLKEN